MIDKLIRVFARFAGDGRAWKLKEVFTRSAITAFLSISKAARNMLNTIPAQAYPWSCDDDVIPYWEKHFGVIPPAGATIEDRRRAVVAEYVAIGSNAAEYLEYILSSNDHDAEVVENLGGLDMGGTWDALNFKIANGDIAMYPNPAGPVTYADPVAKPTNTKEWKKVYILLDAFDSTSVSLLKTLVLKYSSSHTVAMLINNDPNSLYFDAELVNELVDPILVLDAELVVADGTDTINNTVYTGNSFSNTTNSIKITSVKLSPDGSILIATGSGVNPIQVLQFALTTPGDISTATYTGTLADSFPSFPDQAHVDVTPDGSYLFVYVRGAFDRVIQKYTLSTPWDLSTATFHSESAPIEPVNPSGLAINPDQGTVYVTDPFTDEITIFTLTTPGDVSTMVVPGAQFDVLALTGAQISGDLTYNNDGTKLLIGGYIYNTTALLELSLSTPYYLPSATYSGVTFDNPGGHITEGGARAVAIINNGLGMIAGEYTGTLYQYDTPNNFNPIPTTNAEYVLDGELVV